MPDWPRPRSTTTAHPIDSLQDGHDKWITGMTKTIKLQTQSTSIRTWNAHKLYVCSRIQELTHELTCYRWDIIGLSEVRWTGSSETSTEDGHKIWFSGEEKKH